jgi:hypothetical protein
VADREDLPNFSRFGIVLSFPSEEALDHFYRKNLAQSRGGEIEDNSRLISLLKELTSRMENNLNGIKKAES